VDRLRSVDDLKAWRDRLSAARKPDLPTLVIPAGTCGLASGAGDLVRVAQREILSRGLAGRIHLRVTGCHGFCQMEPSVLVEPRRTFYPKVSMKDMVRIVEAAAGGKVVEGLLFRDSATGEVIEKQDDIPFFRLQRRTILAPNEKMDPVLLEDYVAQGGYAAAAKVLGGGDPKSVVEAVKESGLRGRGSPTLPSMERIRAVSSPQTNAPAPLTRWMSNENGVPRMPFPRRPAFQAAVRATFRFRMASGYSLRT